MAVAAYYSWDRLGRPVTPAQPIRELVEALDRAYSAAADENTFSWYADDAHYQANYPEDHTPYSYTGWPEADPPWWVCATDIMHRPDLGVDCQAIFDHWIASARAGLTPWLKYLIWQGQLYDVRNRWAPQQNSGHYDHIHCSTRTDHLETGLGDWNPIPGAPPEEDDMQQYFLAHDPPTDTYWLCDGMFARGPLVRPPNGDEIADIKYLARELGMFKLWIGEDGNDIYPNLPAAAGVRIPWTGTGGLVPHTHATPAMSTPAGVTGPAKPTA